MPQKVKKLISSDDLPPIPSLYLRAATSPRILPSFYLPVSLKIHDKLIKTLALLDCGANGNFISKRFAKQHNIKTTRISEPTSVEVADGATHVVSRMVPNVLVSVEKSIDSTSQSQNSRFPIFAPASVSVGSSEPSSLSLFSPSVLNSSFFIAPVKHDVVLGLPWLFDANPVVDWRKRSVSFELLRLSSVFANPEKGKHSCSLPESVPSEYREYSCVFHEPLEEILPPERPFDLEINLKNPDQLPPYLPIYRLSSPEQKVLKEWITENLEKTFIRPSKSPAAAPIFFVPKKDGSLRPCIDYRLLNANTIPDRYPLPLIPELMDQVRGAIFFTILDLKGAYNLIRIRSGHEWKAAFRCQFGQFEPTVVQFGLTNAPPVFQRFINFIFSDILNIYVVVYLDDILIFSKNLEDHRMHVSEVLKRLAAHSLVVKPSKCLFHQESVTFLGFRLSANGVSPESDKIKAIEGFPVPKNVRDIRSFVGLVNYYRQFIKDFSKLSRPLTRLTKKNVPFLWSDECQAAFDLLKSALLHDVVLPYPDPEKQFFLETDASDFAVGAVLSQEVSPNVIRPVAFFSRTLSDSELNYTVYDKELLGVIEAFKHWRHYLVGSAFPVKVRSDHKNLLFFRTNRILKPRHARWSEFLSQFRFEIAHIPGEKNSVADALSRASSLVPEIKPSGKRSLTLLPESCWSTSDVSVPAPDLVSTSPVSPSKLQIHVNEVNSTPDWPEHIAYFLEHDEWSESAVDVEFLRSKLSDFTLRNDKLYFVEGQKLKLYLPRSQRVSILKRFHEGLGHLAFDSLIDLIEARFWWPNLRSSFRDFLKECAQCQLNRPLSAAQRQAQAQPSRPLPPAALPFERIGLDFVQNLPLTKKGNRHILTCVDYATRWVIARAVPDMEATTVVNFLYEEVLLNHGCPLEIVSDRGGSFLAEVFKEFEQLQSIRHLASTPYHPQTNGLVERMHRMLNHAITTLSNSNPERWDEFLPQTVFSLRVRTHAVTRHSPFYLLYGIEPRLPGDTSPPDSFLAPLDELERREQRLEFTARELDHLGQSRAAAYHRSLAQAERIARRSGIDDSVSDHYFSVGHWVKLKHFARTKFEFRWKGPYIVVKLGFPGTYWLMSPDGRWLDSTYNQVDLAPWTAATIDNQSYFYDGTSRSDLPVSSTSLSSSASESSPASALEGAE